MTKHAASVTSVATQHEEALLTELARLKDQLVSLSQDKVDMEVTLLSEKKQLLLELSQLKVIQVTRLALVPTATSVCRGVVSSREATKTVLPLTTLSRNQDRGA
jgi:hypothetical protein